MPMTSQKQECRRHNNIMLAEVASNGKPIKVVHEMKKLRKRIEPVVETIIDSHPGEHCIASSTNQQEINLETVMLWKLQRIS